MKPNNKELELTNYEETVKEFQEKVIPQIFKSDLLPGYTKPTLSQIEKHILKLSNNKINDNTSMLLVAYGIIYGETIIRTIKGSSWNFDSYSMELLRINLPKTNENDETISILPIKRVLELMKTKKLALKSLTNQYDSIKKEFVSVIITD